MNMDNIIYRVCFLHKIIILFNVENINEKEVYLLVGKKAPISYKFSFTEENNP